MTEFEILRQELPQINFKTYNECKYAMLEIISQHRGFFIPDTYLEHSSWFDILNIELVESGMLTIDVVCHDSCDDYLKTITVPVRYFTDEDFLNQAVEEDRARKQAEALKKQEEQAWKLADPEYPEYLRLQRKFS